MDTTYVYFISRVLRTLPLSCAPLSDDTLLIKTTYLMITATFECAFSCWLYGNEVMTIMHRY